MVQKAFSTQHVYTVPWYNYRSRWWVDPVSHRCYCWVPIQVERFLCSFPSWTTCRKGFFHLPLTPSIICRCKKLWLSTLFLFALAKRCPFPAVRNKPMSFRRYSALFHCIGLPSTCNQMTSTCWWPIILPVVFLVTCVFIYSIKTWISLRTIHGIESCIIRPSHFSLPLSSCDRRCRQRRRQNKQELISPRRRWTQAISPPLTVNLNVIIFKFFIIVKFHQKQWKWPIVVGEMCWKRNYVWDNYILYYVKSHLTSCLSFTSSSMSWEKSITPQAQETLSQQTENKSVHLIFWKVKQRHLSPCDRQLVDAKF